MTGLIVACQDEDGKRLVLSDWSELSLTESTPRESTTTVVEPAEVPGLLAERFGLCGWERNADGRLVKAS